MNSRPQRWAGVGVLPFFSVYHKAALSGVMHCGMSCLVSEAWMRSGEWLWQCDWVIVRSSKDSGGGQCGCIPATHRLNF